MRKTMSIMILFLLGISTSFAMGGNKETFKVYGNCGMCESRIEKAAKSVEGLKTADWNKETKFIEITYDPDKVSIEDVHKSIAGAGHDTEMHRASEEVYNALPGCCKYERPGPGKATNE
jgi:copper chaperone CopZ